MPDAFIWYKANENNESEFLHWLDLVHDHADVRGKLFIRKDANGDQSKATFMESYSDVSSATINRIENLAATQAVFDDIRRQCESFVEIT